MINKAINLKMLVDFTMSIDLTNYPTNYVALCQINQIVEDSNC